MKAWQIVSRGEPEDSMVLSEVETPPIGPHELLIDVGAAAANFPDVLLCRGEYQDRPAVPFTPGLEVCGLVAGIGAEVNTYSVGDRVVGMTRLPHGGFAEMAVMAEHEALSAWPLLDGASMAASYVKLQTAWFALHRRARIRKGEVLLVHAAAGGVGSAAVALGRAVGAKVIAVVGSEAKREFLLNLDPPMRLGL